MPDWVDNAFLIAVVTVVGVVIGHFTNRRSRQEEISATKTNNLLTQQGHQIDRLTKQQGEDRERIARVEKALRGTQVALWDERDDNRRLRRGLTDAVDDIATAWEWIDGARDTSPPRKPRMVHYRKILEEPRPRRPPPDYEEST